jgi:ribonuclease E
MGHVRSPESAALHILRAIEDEGGKFRAAEISVVLPPEIAFYLFNHKRERLSAIEARYAMRVIFTPDASMTGTNFRIDKIKAQTAAPPVAPPASYAPIQPERRLESPAAEPEAEATEAEQDEADAPSTNGTDAPSANDTAEEGERKRKRRRRRGKRRDGVAPPPAVEGEALTGEAAAELAPVEEAPSEFDLVLAAELGEPGEVTEAPAEESAPRKRRSRGGRRRKGADGEVLPETDTAPPEPVYADIADIFEAAERAEAAAREARALARQAEAAPELEPVGQETAPAAPEPLVKPIVIGADAPAAEKKRGWWRR